MVTSVFVESSTIPPVSLESEAVIVSPLEKVPTTFVKFTVVVEVPEA